MVALLTCVFASTPASAQDTVVVWTHEARATDTARLCNTLLIAELDASGFMIQSMDSDAPPTPDDLDDQAPSVFAWVVILANNQTTSATLFAPKKEGAPEQLTTITLQTPQDARPAALQLTELLRARQEALELEALTAPADSTSAESSNPAPEVPGEPPAAPVTITSDVESIAPPAPRWRASARAGLGASRASALTPTPSVHLGMIVRRDRLGVGVSALAPTWPLIVKSELADARVFTSRVVGAVSWRFSSLDRLRLDAELGAGWWRMSAIGLAEGDGATLTNKREVAHSPVILAGASMRSSLTRHLTFGARVTSGLVTTPVQLRVAEEPLGRVGAPLIGIDLFIERAFQPEGDVIRDDPP